MNTTALLIGLGPLLGWGLYPTIASKIGGRPVNQILGSTLGTLIFAIVFALYKGMELPTGSDLTFSILSGVGWAIAQIITFQSFTLIGSSRAMPITTAFQLLGASLWGVFALGNWPGATAKVLGAFALVLIILGAWMTVWTEKKNTEGSNLLKKAVLLLAVGEIGYWAYSMTPQATSIDGMHAFLPQAIGMVIVAVVYSAVLSFKEKSAFVEVVSYKHIFSGFFFAFCRFNLFNFSSTRYEWVSNRVYSFSNIRSISDTDWYLVPRTKENQERNDCYSYWTSLDFSHATITVMI